MKLKRLDVSGFKSFIDKTRIDFPPGISAIVGPNGCGKSNVVDALRWVMGEQSVKQLRGKAMEDVIFSGSDGKHPLNMAEVSLTLINNNGTVPEEFRDYSEIMVTRRLYRSGDSNYFINKQPCRLKDIHNLFMGTGMGAKTYAVIQQGSIGAITDAGPEDRRVFLEEAAGTTRYKSRKNEALRKLEATNQNLLRVSDIIAEVKRQMSGLKRQAKRAEWYQEYQKKIQELDVYLTQAHYDDYTGQIEHTRELLKDLRDSDLEHSSKLKKVDAAIEEIKLKRWKKNQEISKQKSDKFETQRDIDRLENNLSHLRKDVERLADEIASLETACHDIEEKNRTIISEMAGVEQEHRQFLQEMEATRAELDQEKSAARGISDGLAALQNKLESDKKRLLELVTRESQYKNVYQNAANNKENLNRRLKRLNEEEKTAENKQEHTRKTEERLKGQLAALQNDLENFGGRIDTAQKALAQKSSLLNEHIRRTQTLELERNKARSSHSTLKKMEENYEWYKDGVRAILKSAETERDRNDEPNPDRSPNENDVLGVMADIIEPEASFEIAVESALGESLQYILVKDQPAAERSIDFLQKEAAGRSGFIPVSAIKRIPQAGDQTHDHAPNRLLSHIKVKKGFEEIVDKLLAHMVIADTLKEAVSLFNRNGMVQTIVTKNGDIVSPQGVLIGGTKENISGILAKKQEIKALEEQVDLLDQSLDAAHGEQDELESEVRSMESDLQKLIEQKHKITQSEIETEKSCYKAGEDHKNAERHLEIIRLEQQQMIGEECDIDDEMNRYNHLLGELEKEVEDAQAGVSEISETIRIRSSEMDKFNRKIVDFKLKITSLSAKLENTQTTLRRLHEFKDDGIQRLGQIAVEIRQKHDKKTTSVQKIADHGQRLTRMYEQLKEMEEAIDANETDYRAIDETLKENDSLVSNLQNKREEVLQKIRLLELEQSQQKIKRENLIGRIEERYQLPFADLKTKTYQEDDQTTEQESMTIAEMEEKLSVYKDKIAAIKDVNLGAIKEYDEQKTRFDFLIEQRGDLEKAMDDLHKVIKKINRISQERFMTTFDQVNEKLAEVFPRLFEGGTAKLVLTQPDKPLETGVEFMIHPPGKKLTRMSLLSGGEKALSAIAFIFSIFLLKPAAFCLMDEIDAPLDEANIDRFSNLLKIIGEKSQIIMITHNKRSMEFADTLFGITMETKGISKVVSVNLENSGETRH
jgi:chromosome segregation protein